MSSCSTTLSGALTCPAIRIASALLSQCALSEQTKRKEAHITCLIQSSERSISYE